jgi:two-component system NarL family sensor kinase
MEKIGSTDFLVILFVGMTGMFLLAFAIVMFAYFYRKRITEQQLILKQSLIQTAVDIQEQERKRFAADLHDEIGGGISAALLSLSGLGMTLKNSPREKQKVEDVQNQLDGLLQTVREISYNLTPQMLESYGLVAALNDLCYQIHDTGVMQANFNSTGIHAGFPVTKELAIYRICKELITNSIKHSRAQQLSLSLHCDENYFTISYQDNGQGYAPATVTSGSGMQNMINRAKILDAQFEVASRINKGIQVTLTLKR